MGVKVSNNAFGTLSAAINSTATTITVDSGQGARFPTLGAGDYFYATLVDTANNLEIVKVTARSADSMTAVRAQDGTTALSFAIGDRIELRPVAALFEDIIDGAELVTDTTPQLGGNLDLNSNDITGTGNLDFTGEVTQNSLDRRILINYSDVNASTTTITDLDNVDDNGIVYSLNPANAPHGNNGMLLSLSTKDLGGTSNAHPDLRQAQLYFGDEAQAGFYYRVRQGASNWHRWIKGNTDWAMKQGPTSWNSAYKSNFHRGYKEGYSMDATSNGTGITILQTGYYECHYYQRTGTSGDMIGLSVNGSRATLESRTEGLWGHDHAGSVSGHWSHSVYIGLLNSGELICGGGPSTQGLQFGSSGYNGGLYIKRLQ